MLLLFHWAAVSDFLARAILKGLFETDIEQSPIGLGSHGKVPTVFYLYIIKTNRIKYFKVNKEPLKYIFKAGHGVKTLIFY